MKKNGRGNNVKYHGEANLDEDCKMFLRFIKDGACCQSSFSGIRGRSHIIVAEKQMGVEVEEMVTMPLSREGRSMTRK